MASDPIQLLANVDQNLLLYLNGFRNTSTDYFMSAFIGRWIWVSMYASILCVPPEDFSWKITSCCLAAIVLTITFADQVCAGPTRPVVKHLRPANPENPISDLVHIVNNYRGGRYGFLSCHTSNSSKPTFSPVFPFRKQWLSLSVPLRAALSCYMHTYLGVRYPGGSIAGTVIGYCGAALMCYLLRKIARGTSLGKVKHTEIMVHTDLPTTLGILIRALVMA